MVGYIFREIYTLLFKEQCLYTLYYLAEYVLPGSVATLQRFFHNLLYFRAYLIDYFLILFSVLLQVPKFGFLPHLPAEPLFFLFFLVALKIAA